METAVVLFTRDLRVHDHPSLHQALETARRVVPLFVVDPAIVDGHHGRPNRARFLHDALVDLRGSLRGRGGDLVIGRGDPAAVTAGLVHRHGAAAVFATADVTPFAHTRQERLRPAVADAGAELVLGPGVSVVDPGALTPAGGDHYKVFTPYHRAWTSTRWRRPVDAPARVPVPADLDAGELPTVHDLGGGGDAPSPDLPRGGETAGRDRLARWAADRLAGYAGGNDDLAGDQTSRLSPYFHFGCLSPLEVACDLDGRDGAGAFLRQLCWRDFHHQVTDAFGPMSSVEYRTQGDEWLQDEESATAWREGRTGYPIVDAGMRQLRREGWMHNRARLITASFLVKDLYVDWRTGARHFLDWLVDGDVAQNSANWQWVAGTGNDTRPNRVFNPLRQAERFDPDGAYVRRHVPELAEVPAAHVHRPWRLGPRDRPRGYPAPIVDHDQAQAAFRARRQGRPAAAHEQGRLPV